ncbi:MAG: hypothetical protein H6605_05995 [Flavobacteriales bacterium]|nr:hypothetical protein [Flavobacteriales bacterium]
MNTKKILNGKVLRLSLLLLLFTGLTSSSKMAGNYNGLVVITHSQTSVGQLKKSVFEKMIFGEKQTWPNGKAVFIGLCKPTNPTGIQVAKDIFDMSANEFNKYWLGLVFEGKCKAPALFSDEDDLINFIANTPNSIGVISESSYKTKVKRITINN